MTMISFKNQFIFIKPRKVAGTSLELALSRFCGKDDVKSPAGPFTIKEFQECRYQYPLRRTVTLVDNGKKREAELRRHMSAKRIQRLVGDDVFRSFLKISVIRNPYDRIVNRYTWCCKLESVRKTCSHVFQEPSASHFREWLMRKETTARPYYGPMTFNRPYDGVDVLIRFEHFEEDLTALSQKLGLAENIYDTFKNIRARGDERLTFITTRACFEGFPEGIAKVKKLYTTELETFGYDLPWLSDDGECR